MSCSMSAPKLRQLDKNAYEAALDPRRFTTSGAHKVIPEIMPASSRRLSWRSLCTIDDFVVSYFTAGTTSQPLSVVIYSMTRHRMTPQDPNAISTILFLIVLALLIVIMCAPSRDEKRRRGPPAGKERCSREKNVCFPCCCAARCAPGCSSGCGNASSAEVLNVYNWGEYIDTGPHRPGSKRNRHQGYLQHLLIQRKPVFAHPDHELRRHYPVRLRDFALYRRGYAPKLLNYDHIRI